MRIAGKNTGRLRRVMRHESGGRPGMLAIVN
jgi:hypothetical protein